MQTVPFERRQQPHQQASESLPAPVPPLSTPLTDLATRWIDHASLLALYGAEACAKTLRRCSDDLSDAITSDRYTAVSLTTAAKLSAYSADHLGRLVREGKLKNYGQRNRPRVRVDELPRKSAKVAAGIPDAYDAVTDARNLRSRGRMVS